MSNATDSTKDKRIALDPETFEKTKGAFKEVGDLETFESSYRLKNVNSHLSNAPEGVRNTYNDIQEYLEENPSAFKYGDHDVKMRVFFVDLNRIPGKAEKDTSE